MDALAISRLVGLLVWSVVAVWLAPSFYRGTFEHGERPRDATWSLLWFVAVGVLVSHVKWVLGITTPITEQADYQATLALVVVWDILAFAILHRRWVVEGWRL